MPRWSPGDFKVQSGVSLRKPKDALIARTADAVERGEFVTGTKAAVEVVNEYYGYDVWALGEDAKTDRKIKHVAERINEELRRRTPAKPS